MNAVSFNESAVRYLETATRFYRIILLRDLLGDLVIFLCWGGKHNRLGGTRSVVVESVDSATALIDEIASYRLKRGYWEIYYPLPAPLPSASPIINRIEKPSVVKKSDALDPKKYIQMLKKCQTALPELFKDNTVSVQAFCQAIQQQFAEYSTVEVSALLRQWRTTPIFIGDIFKEDDCKDE